MISVAVAAAHPPGRADLGGGRLAGLPAAGLERAVRAEGNAGGDHREAQRALRTAVASEALQARMDDLGAIPASGEELTPEYIQKLVPAEIEKFRKLLVEKK